MNRIFLFLFLLPLLLSAQQKITLTGKVFDSKTEEPLAFATIGINGFPEQTSSNEFGDFSFSVPDTLINDSINVRYIGYKTFTKVISSLQQQERIYLTEAYVLLREIVISHKKLNLRAVDNHFKNIRGNIYAMETELKNEDYNLFLAYLEEYDQTQLLKQCGYELSRYSKSEKEFYRRYSGVLQPKSNKKDTVDINYSRYPAVNISHEAAIKYCEWLTDQYNNNPAKAKKKFTKVKFRLPTLNEWQIAALGDPKFQSWKLNENYVEVVRNKQDTTSVTPKRGERIKLSVEKDVLYPWWESYNYRNSATNYHNCFLGNFKITGSVAYKSCTAYFNSYDGALRMAHCGYYFPNRMGLYDVVGNVAEMIDEKGKACGGSWDDSPAESTIHSVKNYKHSDASIGFRVFMEVIEK